MDIKLNQPKNIGLVNWIGLWTLSSREIKRFLKVYTQTICAPMMTSFLYYMVFSLAIGSEGRVSGDIKFVEFLVPGLMIMAMVQNAFANTSSSILISKYDGSIVDYLMPPLSAFEFALAKVIGGIARGATVGLAIYVFFSIFMDIQIYHIGYIVFYSIMGCMMLAILGVIGAVWAEKFDHIAAMTNFVVLPMTFLSGTFYSIDRLPDNLRFMADFNPFFYMIDGFRYGFIDHNDSNLFTGILVMLGMNIFLWFICLTMLAKGYKIKN